MKKVKLSDAQIDQLSFDKKTLIKGILSNNVNIYNDDSLQDKLKFIMPNKLEGRQEDFIFSMIYKGKNIEPDFINIALREPFVILAYSVFTDRDEEDEVHFLYNVKDFSFHEVRYYKESDELEGIWN
jgi:hypothetical protein